jgi:hypothetical protein
LFALALIFCLPLVAQKPVDTGIAKLQHQLLDWMRQAEIPGVSLAVLRHGKTAWIGSYGIANKATQQPVTEKTVFNAASLSKTVFAYTVLRLVDQGELDLDTPLTQYLSDRPRPTPGQSDCAHCSQPSKSIVPYRQRSAGKVLLLPCRFLLSDRYPASLMALSDTLPVAMSAGDTGHESIIAHRVIAVELQSLDVDDERVTGHRGLDEERACLRITTLAMADASGVEAAGVDGGGAERIAGPKVKNRGDVG